MLIPVVLLKMIIIPITIIIMIMKITNYFND